MPSIAIIGAGCSGLAAAHELRDAGYAVTVFEKNHRVGGRAATRERIVGAGLAPALNEPPALDPGLAPALNEPPARFIYDHGAQYIKGDSPVSDALITGRFRLADLVDIAKPVWIFDRQGHIQEGDPLQNAQPKWTYRSGLNALAKRMAQGLDIRQQTHIAYLRHNVTGWSLYDRSGQHAGEFNCVLVAIPASQAVELIQASQLAGAQQENICRLLREASYNPLISVMLGYRPAPQARPYYALVNTDKAHVISWLAWEHEKAPERVPDHAGLLIAQMAPQYSRDHWDLPAAEIISDVANRVTMLLDEPLDEPIFTDVYDWRYALPVQKADAQQLNAITLPMRLAFCGDAFAGGRVHLALEHGIEIARQLINIRRGEGG